MVCSGGDFALIGEVSDSQLARRERSGPCVLIDGSWSSASIL